MTKHPDQTIHSKPWPGVRAEIYREHDNTGAVVWRTKIAHTGHPNLAKESVFETREQALAHVKICLGN